MNKTETDGKDDNYNIEALCASIIAGEYSVSSDLQYLIGLTIYLTREKYGNSLDKPITQAYTAMLNRLGVTVAMEIKESTEVLH